MKRLILRSFLIFVALLSAGCGGDPLGPEDFNINGTWSGTTNGVTFTLTIYE